ncbi:hypothetical protein ACS0TY_008454 [Phlomoides rotata]
MARVLYFGKRSGQREGHLENDFQDYTILVLINIGEFVIWGCGREIGGFGLGDGGDCFSYRELQSFNDLKIFIDMEQLINDIEGSYKWRPSPDVKYSTKATSFFIFNQNRTAELGDDHRLQINLEMFCTIKSQGSRMEIAMGMSSN